jgi:hypothetical protein
MSDPVVVPANRRGGFVLVNNNYRYVRNRTRSANITWRCCKKCCGAILKTNFFDVTDETATILGKNVYLDFHCFIFSFLCKNPVDNAAQSFLFLTCYIVTSAVLLLYQSQVIQLIHVFAFYC